MKLFTILALASHALAFCCSGPQCADGTNGTPCCATESCNIFCCACGGICRGSSGRRRRGLELLAGGGDGSVFAERDPGADEAFAQADAGQNGNLTMDRKSLWVNTLPSGAVVVCCAVLC